MQQTKLNYIAKSLSKNNKIYENFVINSIYSKLNNPNIEIATQQYVCTKESRRYIDLYFPQFKIAIEVNEPYHENPIQKDKDKKRMEAINLSILESTILDDEGIKFRTIDIEQNGKMLTLEDLNKRIDEIVFEIKKIASAKKDLSWDFDREIVLNKIIQRGYLQRGDSFSSMVEILSLFGKKVKGFQRCYYKNIWSPTLSIEGSNKNGWINTISTDLNEIYEVGLGKHQKKPSDVDKDIQDKTKRCTFLRYKDALGNQSRRFLGVYMADRYDYEKKAEVWKFTEDTVKLHKL